MKLSVVLNTARGDYPYVGASMAGVHLFTPTLRSLAAQEEPIHELIIVDGVFDWSPRGCLHELMVEARMEVRRLPPRSPLFPDYVTICAAKNTGLAAATGDAVWFVDDGGEFPPHATRVLREMLEAGAYPSALVHYYEDGRPAPTDGAKVSTVDGPERYDPGASFERLRAHSWDLYGPAECVKDARIRELDRRRVGAMRAGGEWWRGYTAAPRAELEAVGGYDETLDGTKSVEDCDMGLRMQRAHHKPVAVDRRFWCIEHRAQGYDPRAVLAPGLNFKCNTGLLLRNNIRAIARWGKIPRAELDTMGALICRRCHNRLRCTTEHLGAQFRPPRPSAEEAVAFERWVAAYVEG